MVDSIFSREYDTILSTEHSPERTFSVVCFGRASVFGIDMVRISCDSLHYGIRSYSKVGYLLQKFAHTMKGVKKSNPLLSYGIVGMEREVS